MAGSTDPGSYLRTLAQKAFREAAGDSFVIRAAVAIQAVANAFVMLGLLRETEAEAVLTDHKMALEDIGFNIRGFELTLRSGAHGYWESRMAERGILAQVPLAVAPSRVRCRTSLGPVFIDWVKLIRSGLRLRVRVIAVMADNEPVPAPALVSQAMLEVSVSDEAGRAYLLTLPDGGMCTVPDSGKYAAVWHGEVIVEPKPPGAVSWLVFAPTPTGQGARVALMPPASVMMGKSNPPWPTPAENYLSAIAPSSEVTINGTVLGPQDTAYVVDAVADGLLAVGALPVDSSMRRRLPGPGHRDWHLALIQRWRRQIHLQTYDFLPGEQLGLAITLPMEHACAVIEGISVLQDRVFLQLYGHPWVVGEYWPISVPSFEVRAVDNIGNHYEALPAGTWRGSEMNEGSAGFVFWPPIMPDTMRMRVIVSTLWEAAWAEIELAGLKRA